MANILAKEFSVEYYLKLENSDENADKELVIFLVKI